MAKSESSNQLQKEFIEPELLPNNKTPSTAKKFFKHPPFSYQKEPQN
jgi:hypothetical protein